MSLRGGSPPLGELAGLPGHSGTPRSVLSPQGLKLLALLGVLLVSLGALLYGPTLRLSYAFDDIDHLNLAADALSGRTSFVEMLRRPHHEHVIPAFRVLALASVRLLGTNATPVRAAILLAHLGSGLLLGVLVYRLTGSRRAVIATGIAYVLPAGLSSLLVWFPSGGTYPIGTLALTAAMLLVTMQAEIGRRRALVGAGLSVLAAVLLENGLFPIAATPALLDEIERRRDGRPSRRIGGLTIHCAVIAIGAVAATLLLHERTISAAGELSPVVAMRKLGFLALVAPFRALFPAQHLPSLLGVAGGSAGLGMAFGFLVAAVISLLIVGLCSDRSRRLLTVLICSIPGPLAFLALVAAARAGTTAHELFDSDRYFFPLLIPLALAVGVVASSTAGAADRWSRPRRVAVGTLIAAIVAVQLALHLLAVRRAVPIGSYDAHARRFAQLSRLSEILDDASSSASLGGRPLEVPDGSFFFDDVHNKRLSTRFLLFVARPSRTGRVVLGPRSVPPVSERVLNEALERWARELGDPQLAYRVANGELRSSTDVGAARFHAGPDPSAILNGFYDWERTYRWMAGEGRLRLLVTGPRLRVRLAAPLTALLRREPTLEGLDVAISIARPEESAMHDVGTVRLSSDDPVEATFPLSDDLLDWARGSAATVVLRSSMEWRPRDVLPGSRDDRVLSVMVFEVCFVDEPAGPPSAATSTSDVRGWPNDP
jgi:hypothetical protein